MEAILARQRSDRERHWEKTMGVPWGKFHRDLCHENQALWFANRFFSGDLCWRCIPRVQRCPKHQLKEPGNDWLVTGGLMKIYEDIRM